MEEQTKAEGRVSRRDLIRGGSEVVGAAAAISGGALFAQQTTGPGATTITTLGFGDIVPLTTTARIVVAAESVIGIVLVGLFLNAVGSQIKRSRDTGRDEKDLIGRWAPAKRSWEVDTLHRGLSRNTNARLYDDRGTRTGSVG